MTINYKIVSGVLSAAIICDTVTAVINKQRFARNRVLLEDARSQRDKARELANLYAQKLNDARIPVDDFDRIVIHTLTD